MNVSIFWCSRCCWLPTPNPCTSPPLTGPEVVQVEHPLSAVTGLVGSTSVTPSLPAIGWGWPQGMILANEMCGKVSRGLGKVPSLTVRDPRRSWAGGSRRRSQQAEDTEQERGEEVTPRRGRATGRKLSQRLCSDYLSRFEWRSPLLAEKRILTDISRNLSNLGTTNYLETFFKKQTI